MNIIMFEHNRRKIFHRSGFCIFKSGIRIKKCEIKTKIQKKNIKFRSRPDISYIFYCLVNRDLSGFRLKRLHVVR